MRNIKLSLSIVYIAVFNILLISETCCGLSGTAEPVTVHVLQEGHAGFTVSLEFQTPQLLVIEDAANHGRLLINMPGAIHDFETDGPVMPSFTRLIAVPDGYTVEAHVRERQDIVLDVEPFIPHDNVSVREIRRTQTIPEVSIGEPGWMRWMKVAPVVIRPARYSLDDHRISVAKRMEIEFEFVPDASLRSNITPDPERYWSIAFEELFSATLLNQRTFRSIYRGGNVVRRGSYLIISDFYLPQAQVVQEFAEWKRRKGFNVVFASLFDIKQGITREEIKEYIQYAFDNWEQPLEFVLLLGDANAPGIELPTFQIENPNYNERNASDHPYSLTMGDDYFPDLFVGRISCDSPNPNEVQRALARYLLYERDLVHHEDFDAEAIHRATIFGSYLSPNGRFIVTPVETCIWLGERLEERNYDVEEFYYVNEWDEIDADDIVRSINRGVNIVAYRGCSDASGTIYPRFTLDNLDELNNGPLLPIFTLFNSSLGNFDHDELIQCFGEAAITRGTRRSPAGALAFYGPSTSHARTQYNNLALAGFYNGLMNEGLRCLGQICLRSKMELYAGFPNQRASGEEVEYYFHIYNILGDPEVNLYLDPPIILNVSHSGTVYYGDSFIEFTVTRDDDRPLRGAFVTVNLGELNKVTVLTDEEGLALVPIELTRQEELEVTVTARQAAPYLTTIPVAQAGNAVGFESVVVLNEFEDDRLVTGSPVDLTVTLHNAGTEEARGVSAELTTVYEDVEIISGTSAFGNIPVDGSATARDPFIVEIPHPIPDGFDLPFFLDIRDEDNHEYRAMFRIPIRSALISYVEHTLEGGVIQPGQSCDLVLTIKNRGSVDIEGLHAEMHTHDEAVIVEDDEAWFGKAEVGEHVACVEDPFTIRVCEGVTPGRTVLLRTRFLDDYDLKVNNVFFNITVGDPGIEDPLGPDDYGYFVYEDVDDSEAYPETPEYNWIELDPDYDGEGADHHPLSDDSTFTTFLPFSFRFYDVDYDTISICSNGWISFQNTWMHNFRNWGIPSPLGPHTMIAIFWEDLVGRLLDMEDRAPLDIFTRYDEEEGRFIIEWSRVYARSSDEDHRQTFEIILYNPDIDEHNTLTGDGEILFQYNEVEVVDRSETNYATVGIQDWNHRHGVEVTFAALYPDAIDSLRPERAIKFTTDPPDRFLAKDDKGNELPLHFELDDPCPNPFNSTTVISYRLPVPSNVSLELFDLTGRRIMTLVNCPMQAGVHNVVLNAGNLASGLYLTRLEASGYVAVRKVVLTR